MGVDVAQPDEVAPFPECDNVELAFFGETTPAAIGLDQMVGPQEAGRMATIWVTAVPVRMGGPGGFGPGPEPPAERLVCMQWPDGGGMAGPVPADWQPPSLLDGDLAASQAGSDISVTLVALAVGALLLVGVSVVAFRREPTA